MIKFLAICPHPSVIIPNIGSRNQKEKSRETIQAMEKLSEIFRTSSPDVVILISPHGPIEYQTITINSSPTLFGEFGRFGDYDTTFQFDNDLEIVRLLTEKANERNIPIQLTEQTTIDHGVSVPIKILTTGYEKKVSVVPIYYSLPDDQINTDFGKVIHDVCQKHKKNIAIIASGDLSHCLTFDAPLGLSLEGPEFDQQIIQALNNNDIQRIRNMPKDLVEKAKECGYLSIIVMLGLIEEYNENELHHKAAFTSLSYQGTTGTGYLVGYWKI